MFLVKLLIYFFYAGGPLKSVVFNTLLIQANFVFINTQAPFLFYKQKLLMFLKEIAQSFKNTNVTKVGLRENHV